MWAWFTTQLGEQPYKDLGEKRTSCNRIVEMFHGSTESEVQENIVKRFRGDTGLRLVIATVAFGLGVNIPDIRYLLHDKMH